MTYVPTGLLRRLPSLVVVAAMLALSLALLGDHEVRVTSAAVDCDGAGVSNAGFEGDLLDGAPECWTIDQNVDEVLVVNSEGETEFQSYGDLGISVDPHEGSQMLRIGGPKRVNEKQVDGDNVVSQIFTVEGSTASFSFRLFSWEHRDLDTFGFDLTDEFGIAIEGVTFESGPAGQAPAAGLQIEMPSTELRGCAGDQLPCQISLDVGDRKDFLDSGWYDVVFSGLPQTDLKLSFVVGGTGNNAHATWAYFDQIPLAPTASFDLSFANVLTAGFVVEDAIEGTVVQFVDLSVDPNDDIVEYHWGITFADDELFNLTSEEQFPIFVPPQEGQYTIELTVSDAEGNSDTAVSGDDVGGFIMPFLDVQNAPPLVDALNMEVLQGADFELQGAYIDGGWLDTHTAEFNIPTAESVGVASIDAASEPALASGVVTADAKMWDILPPSVVSGELRVTDDPSGDFSDPARVGVDAFKISIVDDTDRHELDGANDSFAIVSDADGGTPAHLALTDNSILSYLSEDDQRDFFELRWPGESGSPPESTPQLIPAGAELLVTLQSPAASDYDLAILAVTPSAQSLGQQFIGQQFIGQQFIGQQFIGQQFIGQQFIGQQFIGQQFIGQQFIGQQFIGQQFIGQQFIGQQFIGQQFIGQQFIGQQFIGQQFIGTDGNSYDVNGFQLNPLSQIAALDGSVVGGTDISLNELDLDLPEGVQLLGFAANSGDLEDGILVEVTEPGTRIFAVVVRSEMPTSPEPYRLTVRGSVPPLALAETIGMSYGQLDAQFGGFGDLAAACEPASPLVTNGATNAPMLLHDGGGETIFITQRERMIEMYGPLAWEDMYDALVELADDSLIEGKILSVSSDIFDAWDTNPCSVQAANDTATAIRAELLPYLDGTNGSASYVVLIGNDDVIPFYRVADTTTIGNESNYAMGTFLKPGSPLFHSTDEGYILTQDFYADIDPTPFDGAALYVPDMPIGRLVETPVEIQAQALAFTSSSGALNVDTAAVAGYDFFTDYAEAAAGELGVTPLVGNWSADELRCDWGLSPTAETPTCEPDPVPSVSSMAAHYTHWAALSSRGFFEGDYDDYVSSSEFPLPTPTGAFEYLSFTIGCHAGFITPDDDVVDGVFPFDPALDLAQAMAQGRVIWVASTGYAIGDDEALNYTELLMSNYAHELLSGSGGAGQALVDAKIAYLGALGSITNYDQKVSIEMTLYGLPHYAVVTPDASPPPGETAEIDLALNSMAAHAVLPAGPGDTSLETLVLTPELDPLNRVNAATGSYDIETFYSDGDYETIIGRPTMPRIVLDLENNVVDGRVHGGIMIGGEYDLEPSFDPWIGVPLLEWTEIPPESQVCLPIYWPTPVKFNSIGGDQRAIVYPAAFRCDPSQSALGVVGQYRTFTEQTVQLYRSTIDDYIAPIVDTVTLDDSPTSSGIVVSVEASDSTADPDDLESGIAEVVVVRYRDSSGTVSSFSLQPAAPQLSGTFVVEIPDFETDDQFVVHVIDAAGNIGTNSAKGYLLQFIDVEAQNALGTFDQPTALTATVFGFDQSAFNPGLAHPTRFLWTFGDGEALSGELSVANPDLLAFSVDGDGNATFTIEHTYVGPQLPSLDATVRVVDSQGSIGFDTATVSFCTDPRDVDLDDPTINEEHADILGCGASIDGDQMTITLFMAGDLTDLADPIGDIQYRLRLGVVGQSNEKLVKYRNGDTTGMKSLTVVLDGNAMHFTFSLRELGRKGPLSNADVTFSAETRAGAASTGAAGLLDTMPDDGGVITFEQ